MMKTFFVIQYQYTQKRLKKVVLMTNYHIVPKQLTLTPQKRKRAKEKLYGSIHHFH